MASPSTAHKPLSALTASGSGTVTPLNGASASKARIAGARRTSLMKRPSTPTTTTTTSSPGIDLAKMPRDQLVSLIQKERLSAEETKRKHVELSTELAVAQDTVAEKERVLTAAQGRIQELTVDVTRMEDEIHGHVKEAETTQLQVRDMDKLRIQLRDLEKKQQVQTEAMETERSTWLEQERILTLKVYAAQKGTLKGPDIVTDQDDKSSEAAVSDADALDDSETTQIQFRRSPSLRGSRPVTPKPLQVPTNSNSGSSSVLSGVPIAPEMLAELSELRTKNATLSATQDSFTSTMTSLRSELEDLKRVNVQLMEENESYELLVGEKTLMGELDLKELLKRSCGTDDDDLLLRVGQDEFDDVPSFVSTGTALTGVLEDDEGEVENDDVEQLVLETEGSGTRFSGAVEAQTTKKKRNVSKSNYANGGSNATTGLGLDLAAELAQAEEDEEAAARELEEKKKLKRQQMRQASMMSMTTTSTDVAYLQGEVKTLKDANRALSLYISKIIDRIVALDGFEKVLASDYMKAATPPNPPSPFSHTKPLTPIKASTTLPVTSPVGSNTLLAASSPPVTSTTKVAERASKRLSIDWRNLFGAAKPPPAPPAVMRPLRLASGPLRDTDEDEEDYKERARLQAEMRLLGIEKGTTSSPSINATTTPTLGIIEPTLLTSPDPNVRLSKSYNRRSGFYNNSSSCSTSPNPSIERSNSTELVPGSNSSRCSSPNLNSHQQSRPLSQTFMDSVTASTLIRKSEERDADLKANLDRGTASGFTEIRGHRRRPSKTNSGTITPTTNVTGSLLSRSPDPDHHFSPNGGGSSSSGGRRSVSPAMNHESNTSLNGNDVSSESMLVRAAKRMSQGWSTPKI